MKMPELLLFAELEELLDELLDRLELDPRLLPDNKLLIVPINKLQGRIEHIVLSGPKL